MIAAKEVRVHMRTKALHQN